MMRRILAPAVVLAALLVGFAGCSLPHPNAIIDWVDFVRFGGISYLANHDAGRDLQPADLGPQFAMVRQRLEGNVSDPNYQTQDGDAAFLDAGTPVYRMEGYAPSFRLVARHDGHLMLYEADTNPHAKTGADLLDIGGKVQSIAVNDERNVGASAVTLDHRTVVDALVAQLLAAPVDQNRQANADGPQYFLTFHLADGTQVSRSYQPGSREVARGIYVPTTFVSALAAAMGT